MTTFTRTSNSKATISIDLNRKLHKLNPNIYGGFIEHMGRCIYGGIYDPDSPHADEDGFRKDVIEALRDLKVPVLRYPGGNFTATYHWEDGIGPRENRPSRPELAWLGTEPNYIGTAEFLLFCKKVGCEPYLCLNMGTGTLLDALHWLEYTNSSGKTYYANLRRQHGHADPWGVKYWALGNEVWGPWQVLQTTASEYGQRAHQWAKALKLLDPSIELVLCGETGVSSWDHTVLQAALPFVDMHSIHLYTADEKSHLRNVTAPLAAEKNIETASSLIDLALIEGIKRGEVSPSHKKPSVCFDEWNVWSPPRAPGEKGAEESYSLSDALAVGVWLNVFIRQGKNLGMCNIAQSVNVLSPLMTTKDGIRKQTTWWPLWLWSNFMRGTVLGIHLECQEWGGDEDNGQSAMDWARAGVSGGPSSSSNDENDTRTEPPWLRNLKVPTPWLDVSAVWDGENVNLAVVNISEKEDLRADLRGLERHRSGQEEVTSYQLTGSGKDVLLDRDGNGVKFEEIRWIPGEADGEFVFPKHSITMLRWKA